jgi:hypothetical protein
MSQWYRPSQRLTMPEAARFLGFVDDNDNVGEVQTAKARRFLRRLEDRTGRHVVHDGGKGRYCWTTIKALRDACPDLMTTEKVLVERVDQIEEENVELRELVSSLGNAIVRNQRMIAQLGQHMGVTLK